MQSNCIEMDLCSVNFIIMSLYIRHCYIIIVQYLCGNLSYLSRPVSQMCTRKQQCERALVWSPILQ